MNRIGIFRNLNIILGVVIILFGGFCAARAFLISNKMNKNVSAPEQEALIDSSLITLINEIEEEIETKQDFIFRVKSDPFRLTRVVIDTVEERTAGKFKEKREEKLMRLTATITSQGDNPKAIIKYRNKSYVVMEGDMLGDRYKIMKIVPKKVRISDGAREFEIINIPAAKPGEENAQATPPGRAMVSTEDSYDY
ncbi:MAG: hypothetical protein GY855_10505 [candidate division Zixibacteria bacterium]|nr:hypothetical protein [candidate division Zixibacteria bacterium]